MVERVSHLLPQLQVTVMVRYSGWIFGFMRPPSRWYPTERRELSTIYAHLASAPEGGDVTQLRCELAQQGPLPWCPVFHQGAAGCQFAPGGFRLHAREAR